MQLESHHTVSHRVCALGTLSCGGGWASRAGQGYQVCPGGSGPWRDGPTSRSLQALSGPSECSGETPGLCWEGQPHCHARAAPAQHVAYWAAGDWRREDRNLRRAQVSWPRVSFDLWEGWALRGAMGHSRILAHRRAAAGRGPGVPVPRTHASNLGHLAVVDSLPPACLGLGTWVASPIRPLGQTGACVPRSSWEAEGPECGGSICSCCPRAVPWIGSPGLR